jgi:hypothetical protein
MFGLVNSPVELTMMTKSEKQRIRAKDRKWKSNIDVFFDQLRIIWPIYWKKTKRMIRKALNWYLFYKGNDKALHIIEWVIATIGIVGLYNLMFGGR